MKIAIKISLICCFLATAPVGKAQQNTCTKVLRDYLEEMGCMSAPRAGVTYFMDMEIRNHFVPGFKTHIPQKISIKTYMGKDHMAYQTQQMAVYQDLQDAFVIMHPSKTIMRSNSLKNDDYQETMVQMAQKQIAMIDNSEITACKMVEWNGRKYRQMDLVPKSKALKAAKVRKLSYLYDPKSKMPKKATIYFEKGHKLTKQETIYHTIDFNYKNWRPKSAKQFVLSNGKLKARYTGYKLVDNRQVQ